MDECYKERHCVGFCSMLELAGSWLSSVNTVTRLLDERPKIWSSVAGRGKFYSHICRVHVDCGAHLVFYTIGSGGWSLKLTTEPHLIPR
jgi:hypothetical protein